jgi:hypothetical protein
VKEALDRLLARLRMRLAKTPIPRFFSWWGTELLACLPERWRKLIAGSNEALLVEQDAEEFVVSRERERHTVELGRIARNLGAEAQVAEFRRLQASIQNPALRAIFCIPESSTLTRNLSLPAAAEDNLRQVLGFEMDRQTPFKADQVYFDSRIVARDSASRSLRVELIVLPKALLDPQLASIGGGAIDFDAVDVRSRTDGDGARRGHQPVAGGKTGAAPGHAPPAQPGFGCCRRVAALVQHVRVAQQSSDCCGDHAGGSRQGSRSGSRSGGFEEEPAGFNRRRQFPLGKKAQRRADHCLAQ